MEMDEDDDIDDVLLDVDVRTVYGDMAPRTELHLHGSGVMLTTEDENAIADAANTADKDFSTVLRVLRSNMRLSRKRMQRLR